MTAGAELSLLAEERRIVDGEKHRHRRLVYSNGRQRLGILEIADGVANLELVKSYHGTDIARTNRVGLHVSHALKGMEFFDFGSFRRTVAMGNGYIHAIGERTAMNTSHGDTTGIAAIVETRDEHLRCSLQLFWGRNHLDDFVQQIGDVVGRSIVVLAHPSVLGRTVDHGEIQLVLGGVEREHQVEHHFIHFLRTAVGFVHLIHHDYGLQTNLQSLLQHEASLRHGTFEGINKQQTSVCHIEHTLHFSTEVRVSRSVDDINLHSLIID